MQQVGKGDWDIRIEEEWKGEFSSIVHGFNDMVEHIHNLKLIHTTKRIQLQKDRIPVSSDADQSAFLYQYVKHPL